MEAKLIEKVNKINERNLAIATIKCPGCGKNTCKMAAFEIPLKLKVMFFNVTLGIKITVEYCPSCGYLAVKIA